MNYTPRYMYSSHTSMNHLLTFCRKAQGLSTCTGYPQGSHKLALTVYETIAICDQNIQLSGCREAGGESLCQPILTVSEISFYSPKISETSLIKLTTVLVWKAFKENWFKETYNRNLTEDQVTDLFMLACRPQTNFFSLSFSDML